jgi:transcriptional regulator GlxA family with amidase domain
MVVEERIVNDSNIWSSAGVSAGIDLMLAFIASFAGEKAAGIVQFAAEYCPLSKLYGDLHQNSIAPRYLKDGV